MRPGHLIAKLTLGLWGVLSTCLPLRSALKYAASAAIGRVASVRNVWLGAAGNGVAAARGAAAASMPLRGRCGSPRRGCAGRHRPRSKRRPQSQGARLPWLRPVWGAAVWTAGFAGAGRHQGPQPPTRHRKPLRQGTARVFKASLDAMLLGYLGKWWLQFAIHCTIVVPPCPARWPARLCCRRCCLATKPWPVAGGASGAQPPPPAPACHLNAAPEGASPRAVAAIERLLPGAAGYEGAPPELPLDHVAFRTFGVRARSLTAKSRVTLRGLRPGQQSSSKAPASGAGAAALAASDAAAACENRKLAPGARPGQRRNGRRAGVVRLPPPARLGGAGRRARHCHVVRAAAGRGPRAAEGLRQPTGGGAARAAEGPRVSAPCWRAHAAWAGVVSAAAAPSKGGAGLAGRCLPPATPLQVGLAFAWRSQA